MKMHRSNADTVSLTFFIALVLLCIMSAVLPFIGDSREVRENTLRLHIIANSDGEEDQKNKLLVRDAVVAEFSEALSAGKGIDDAVRVTKSLTEAIALSAEKALRGADCPQSVKAEVETMYFDTTAYEDFTMPAGEYPALCITIGEGKGKNWWCVMYPAMCLPTAISTDSEDAERILSLNKTPRLTAKFAVVEVIESIKAFFEPSVKYYASGAAPLSVPSNGISFIGSSACSAGV